ncbi:MAG: DUF4348 domain-containing protein [Porphyromonadaceae bacterium]|nr:DUF4348 domain-containing protein [Porphyromonadaceae bacterium]
MKTTSLIFPSLFIFLFISCSQGSGEKKMEQGREKTEEEVFRSDELTASDKEEFDEFIRRFSTDESFQFERIKFPISVVVPDTDHEGMAPMKESLDKYDWEMLDLSYDSTYLTRPYDQYSQEVRFKKDTAIVEIRGIDNGIYADYYFAMIDKKWYLVTLYEASF